MKKMINFLFGGYVYFKEHFNNNGYDEEIGGNF